MLFPLPVMPFPALSGHFFKNNFPNHRGSFSLLPSFVEPSTIILSLLEGTYFISTIQCLLLEDK